VGRGHPGPFPKPYPLGGASNLAPSVLDLCPPPQTETLATPLKVSGKYGKRGGIRGKRDRDEEMDRKGM